MSKIEAEVNNYLNQFPNLKKIIKRLYQMGIYTISKKEKYNGEIVRLSPNDNKEYFFGYYDKSPWDITGKLVLCMRAEETSKDPEPHQPAEIMLINTENKSYEVIAKTSAWNVQQGCMLQWLGPDFCNKIIYNDFRNGKYCSVILNTNTKTEKLLEHPVYTVSGDGTIALTLDFARLHRLRIGYGYPHLEDSTTNEKIPQAPCIWKINLKTGESGPILYYKELVDFETRSDMIGAEHKVNHLMISPSGKRFMVLHRWFKGQHKFTRLITCGIDGKSLYNLSDDDMVSHCCWKNDNEILAFENKKGEGPGYYLMRDQTSEYRHLWRELYSDGHPSYAPDELIAITDSYPDRKRMSNLILLKNNNSYEIIAKVFSPFKYDNDTRCDLHPRWDRKSEKVCFDAVFEGHRGLYYVEVKNDE